MKVEVNHLCKKIAHSIILNDVSVCFESGVIYGIKGKNGSGKTMLMRALCGLLLPDSGEIKIDGEQLHKDIDFPRSIGALIENPSFIGKYTGLKNLCMLATLTKQYKKEDAVTAMASVGLNPKDKRTYRKYSLGMKERLGIAQAILKKPKLILLDEPTNGIDSDGIQMLEELLRRLKEAGSTIVVTSHDRDFLDAVTSQCYEMKEGSLR